MKPEASGQRNVAQAGGSRLLAPISGDDLDLYLSLVDARNGNQLWGEQYNRKLTDLVSLQSEIARDVLKKLRMRLSNADKQKAVKNYTANVEAYQLYLKGRTTHSN